MNDIVASFRYQLNQVMKDSLVTFEKQIENILSSQLSKFQSSFEAKTASSSQVEEKFYVPNNMNPDEILGFLNAKNYSFPENQSSTDSSKIKLSFSQLEPGNTKKDLYALAMQSNPSLASLPKHIWYMANQSSEKNV